MPRRPHAFAFSRAWGVLDAHMRNISVLRFAAAFAALCLSACAGDPHSPWYETPQGLTAATGATVSHTENAPLANAPDGDTRVVTVDGLPVSAMSWDEIVLPPGAHTLGVKYNGAVSQGNVTIRALLQAGATYTVKGERDGPCDALLWLQEQRSGQLLGEKQDTHLAAKPMPSGAPPFAVACD